MNIGEKIKEARLEKGLTLQELGEKVGLSQATLSKYETGDIKNIPNTRLKQLSKALDVKISYFLEEKKDKNSLIIEKLTELTEKGILNWQSPTNPNNYFNIDLNELINKLLDFVESREIDYYTTFTDEKIQEDIENTLFYVTVGSNNYCIFKTTLTVSLFVFKYDGGDVNIPEIYTIEKIGRFNIDDDSTLSILYDLASGNEDSNQTAFFNDLLKDLENLQG